MALRLDALLSDFEAGAEPAASRTGAVLRRLIADRDRHARLMNTLSMLEHMGSYKILATQRGAAIDQPTLKHVTEEARHAWFFKRQAERLAGRPLDYAPERLLAPAAAWMYFQKVEAVTGRRLGPAAVPPAVYLLTSMIVEFRAIWFYRLYQRALDDQGFALSLKKLTGEEEVHLRDMAARLGALGGTDLRLDELLAAERSLYARLLRGLERAAAPAAVAA